MSTYVCEHCGWSGDDALEAEQPKHLHLNGRLDTEEIPICPDCGRRVWNRFEEE